MALDRGDYAKYADLLSQWNTDRSFDYGVYRDNISDQRYEDETEWERSQYASETEYNQALAKAQILAAAGDFSGYKALGYTDAEIANLKTAYDKAQAAARSSGGSGGSSSSGGSTSGSDGGSDGSGIVDTMLGMGSDAKAYEYLIGKGYSNAKTEQLWTLYEAAKENDGGGQHSVVQRLQRGRRLYEAKRSARRKRVQRYDKERVGARKVLLPAIRPGRHRGYVI